jgi:plastocyanin
MNKIRNLLLIGLTFLGPLLIFGLVSTTTGQEEPTGTFYVVEMYDFIYDPPGLLLEAGDRVAWILLEDHLVDGHSATAYHPDQDKFLRVPETAGPWSTSLMEGFGAWQEITFDVLGVHDYFCIPHETEGMVGRIIVGAPQGGPGTQPSSIGISPAGQSTIPTIDEIMNEGGLIFNAQALVNVVVFHMRQGSTDDARSALNSLIDDINDGSGQGETLNETLSRVGAIQPVLNALDELGAKLTPEFTINEISDAAEDIKIELDNAYQQILATGAGA